MQAVSDHTTKKQEAKIQQWKDRFNELHNDVVKEREKWLSKYSYLEKLTSHLSICQQIDLPVLGTLTSNVASLDEKYNVNESEVKVKVIQMHLE